MAHEEVTQWIESLANGDQEAATQLWEEYFEKLARLARRKLDGLPLRDSDENDIVQSAMYSFYEGAKKHRFDALRNRDDLWKLLVTITARKVTAKRRKHFAQKRGGGKVRGESIFIHGDDEEAEAGIGNVLGSEPTPELAADLAENCQTLLDRLDDEILRQIALLTLQGYKTEEIAGKLDCTRRTVERKLNRIREIWGDGEMDADELSQPTR